MKNTLTIALMLLFSVVAATAQTVTVHEASGAVSQKSVSGAALSSMRPIPYAAGNNDFTGLSNEYYDVFFSDPTGSQVSGNPSCVTIRGQYAGSGQGFNISRVDLTNGGLTKYYSSVASYTLGAGGLAGSQTNAVDQLTTTTTMFGQASGKKFMHITVCELKNIPPVFMCCPPITPDTMVQQFFYKGKGNIADDYTLKFKPTPEFKKQMQQYINFANAMNANLTQVGTIWSLLDCGTAGVCPPASNAIESHGTIWVPRATNDTLFGEHTGWGWPNFFGDITNHTSTSHDDMYPMRVGIWYGIHAWSSFNETPINKECDVSDIMVRIQVMAAKGVGSEPVLEISDKQKVIKRIPLREMSKPAEQK